MKKIIATLAAVLALGLTAAACSGGSTQSKAQRLEQKQQAGDTLSLVNNQPLPHFNWSQYRQTIIDSETIAANGTQTTSFFFNQGVRDPIFSCPSLGMPVPNTAQLSNPAQVQWNTAGSSGVASAVIGQMDPYGAYTPSSSTGTFVICIAAGGKRYLQYWEGFVQSVSAPAVWDYKNHVLKVTGAPTFTVKTKP